MARRTHEEFTRIWWAETIDDITAPTVAELTAAIDISAFVPKDGLKVGATNAKVKNDDITTAFTGEIPGSYGNSITLTSFRDDDEDTAWETFQERNTYGYLVVRRMVPVTVAVAAAQVVEVYPAATGQPTMHDTAENERVKFGVDLMVHEAPAMAATVAA